MKRTFIYDPGVEAVLARNRVTDRQLREVELQIMRGAGVTVAGTGGIRKIRCGSAERGKSGSCRLFFADLPAVGLVLMLAALGKNETVNLSKSELNHLRKLKRTIDQWAHERASHEEKGQA